MTIQTARLELIPMTPEFLSASLKRDITEAERLLNVALPPEWPEIEHVLRADLAKLEADPALLPWLLRAFVLGSTREMVGYGGFHAPPGRGDYRAISPGAAESGYTILPAFRRLGL